MRIVIQFFSNDDDTKGVEWHGDTVAEAKTFAEAREAIDQAEDAGI